MQITCIACWIVIGVASADKANNENVGFTKRGPLDKHAGLVQQVLDTLRLEPQQKVSLKKIVAEGHAAWRAWFRKNHEKVDAFNKAIQAAKAAGDKQKLNKVRKEKKAFMHMAPSLLRKPEPLRKTLTEEQRKLFDERLLKLKRDLHRPPKTCTAPRRRGKLPRPEKAGEAGRRGLLARHQTDRYSRYDSRSASSRALV